MPRVGNSQIDKRCPPFPSVAVDQDRIKGGATPKWSAHPYSSSQLKQLLKTASKHGSHVPRRARDPNYLPNRKGKRKTEGKRLVF